MRLQPRWFIGIVSIILLVVGLVLQRTDPTGATFKVLQSVGGAGWLFETYYFHTSRYYKWRHGWNESKGAPWVVRWMEKGCIR